jgi:hypothetical protein
VTEGVVPLIPETADDWEKVKDHAIQIFLMLMMMCCERDLLPY